MASVVLLPEQVVDETMIEAVPAAAAEKTTSPDFPEKETELPDVVYPEPVQLIKLSMLEVYFTVIVPDSEDVTETVTLSPTAGEFLDTAIIVVP